MCSWSRSSLSQRPTTAISGHQHLQSAVTSTLLVLRARTATSQQSFTVNGPATWNRLPPALWSPDLSDSAFKQALKTHLFLTARRHLDVFMILVPDLLTYFTDMAVIAIWSGHQHLQDGETELSRWRRHVHGTVYPPTSGPRRHCSVSVAT